jgi:hypothetical protein
MSDASGLTKLTLADPALAAALAGRRVPFFCSPTWNRVLEEGLGTRTAYYGLGGDESPATLLTGSHLRLGPVRMFYANLPYGGVIGDESRFGELVERLGPALKREGVHEIRIVRTSEDGFAPPAGYLSTEAVHHVLDLRALPTDNPSLYPSSVMRNVKRARSAGVVVRPMTDEAEIGRLFDLYCDTMRRHNAPATWTRGFLHAIHARLVASGVAQTLAAECGGRVVAALMLIRDGQTMYYFLGASDPASSDARPNDALFYEAIRTAESAGCTRFDFMTSRPTDEGLIRFKEKWGGVCRPVTIYRQELSPLHARLWHWTQRVAGSRLGAAVVRFVQKHR